MAGQELAQKPISQYFTEIGQEIYGEEFSIEQDRFRKPYQTTFEILKKSKGKQGVLVIGGLGTGKSAMMRVQQKFFKDISFAKFRWVNAYELRDMSEEMTLNQIKEMYGRAFTGNLYIDDIGISLDAKRYGNTVNIIAELIMERYDLFISSNKMIKTHFSSNIVPDAPPEKEAMPTLKKMYGARGLDRLKEMCSVVIFSGKSLR